MKRPHPSAWLWWLALVIASVAAIAVATLHLDRTILDASIMTRKIIMAAVIAIGICIISATSHWWVHR